MVHPILFMRSCSEHLLEIPAERVVGKSPQQRIRSEVGVLLFQSYPRTEAEEIRSWSKRPSCSKIQVSVGIADLPWCLSDLRLYIHLEI